MSQTIEWLDWDEHRCSVEGHPTEKGFKTYRRAYPERDRLVRIEHACPCGRYYQATDADGNNRTVKLAVPEWDDVT